LPPLDAPVISSNLAKNQPSNSSWSDDMNIMDFANDDDFTTSWISNLTVKSPWYEIDFDREKGFNTIVVAEEKANITNYKLEYEENGVWKTIFDGENGNKIKIHRFNRVWGNKVRISVSKADHQVSIAEFGVYNEQR
jgi:alpha-L-fucosidase